MVEIVHPNVSRSFIGLGRSKLEKHDVSIAAVIHEVTHKWMCTRNDGGGDGGETVIGRSGIYHGRECHRPRVLGQSLVDVHVDPDETRANYVVQFP